LGSSTGKGLRQKAVLQVDLGIHQKKRVPEARKLQLEKVNKVEEM
jgi:hypothetical protein